MKKATTPGSRPWHRAAQSPSYMDISARPDTFMAAFFASIRSLRNIGRWQGMLARTVMVAILAVASWNAQAQPQAIWSCEGRNPTWRLYLTDDTVTFNYRKTILTFPRAQSLEPNEQRPGNRIWVYQLEISPTVLKVVVEESRGRDCPYFEENAQIPKRFTGIVITTSEVFVGCCWSDKKN
jgi:hypothetical protein